jgi:hypothetical protein
VPDIRFNCMTEFILNDNQLLKFQVNTTTGVRLHAVAVQMPFVSSQDYSLVALVNLNHNKLTNIGRNGLEMLLKVTEFYSSSNCIDSMEEYSFVRMALLQTLDFLSINTRSEKNGSGHASCVSCVYTRYFDRVFVYGCTRVLSSVFFGSGKLQFLETNTDPNAFGDHS